MKLHSLNSMAKGLNRPVPYLQGLQTRFELPVFNGEGYSDAYYAFLRSLVHLRTLGISEDTLRDLWHLEKKLLKLLHVDSGGSPTWYLDACGQSGRMNRRLLLTNRDLEIDLSTKSLQLGLNLGSSLQELFAGSEMGEDAARVLADCMKLRNRIRSEARAEIPHMRGAIRWFLRNTHR